MAEKKGDELKNTEKEQHKLFPTKLVQDPSLIVNLLQVDTIYDYIYYTNNKFRGVPIGYITYMQYTLKIFFHYYGYTAYLLPMLSSLNRFVI